MSPEGDDNEVDGNGVERVVDRVFSVEVDESMEDGDVGWVGSLRVVVFTGHGFEESSE